MLLGAFTVISASSANTLKLSRGRLPEPAVTAAPAPAQTAEFFFGGGNRLSISSAAADAATTSFKVDSIKECNDSLYSAWEYKGYMRYFLGSGSSYHLYNDSTSVERRYLLSDPTKVQYRFGNMLDTDSLIMDGDTYTNTGTVLPQRSNWVVDREGYVDSCFMAQCSTVRFSDAGGYIGFFKPEFLASTDYENYKSVYIVNGYIPMQIDGYEVPVFEYEKEACYDRNTREAVIKLNTGGGVSRVRYYLSDYVQRFLDLDDAYNDYEHANYATDEIRVSLDSVGKRKLLMFPEDDQGRWIAGGLEGLQGYQIEVASNIVDDREWIEYGDVTFYNYYSYTPHASHYSRKCLTPADAPGSILRVVNPYGLDTPFGREHPDLVINNDEYYIDINVVDQDHCYTSYRPAGMKQYYYFENKDSIAVFPNASVDINLRLGYSLEELMSRPYNSFTPIKDNRIEFYGGLSFVVALPSEMTISDDVVVSDDQESIYYELTISDAVAGVKYVVMPVATPLGLYGEIVQWVEEIRNGATSVSNGGSATSVRCDVETIYASEAVSRSDSKRTIKIDVSDYFSEENYHVIAIPFGHDNQLLSEYVSAPIRIFKYYGNAHFAYDENDKIALAGFNDGCEVEVCEPLDLYRLKYPFGSSSGASKYMYIRDYGSYFLFGDVIKLPDMFDILLTSCVLSGEYNLGYLPRELVNADRDCDCYKEGDTFYLPSGATCVIDYNSWYAWVAGDLEITVERPKLPAPPDPDVSEIDEVISPSEDGPVEYFDLMGRSVKNPRAGIYIRRQGSTVSKVYIK